jgi:hypothetical protein
MNRGDRERQMRFALRRKLERLSDWELERGLASSEAFDHDQRVMADRLLSERYAWAEQGVAFWVLVLSLLAACVGAALLL